MRTARTLYQGAVIAVVERRLSWASRDLPATICRDLAMCAEFYAARLFLDAVDDPLRGDGPRIAFQAAVRRVDRRADVNPALSWTLGFFGSDVLRVDDFADGRLVGAIARWCIREGFWTQALQTWRTCKLGPLPTVAVFLRLLGVRPDDGLRSDLYLPNVLSAAVDYWGVMSSLLLTPKDDWDTLQAASAEALRAYKTGLLANSPDMHAAVLAVRAVWCLDRWDEGGRVRTNRWWLVNEKRA